MRKEEIKELTKLRKQTSAESRSIGEIDKAFVEYNKTMDTKVMESLEPVSAGFEAFKKRLALVENRLENLTSDRLVTYLKETKEDHEQEQWKTDIQAQMDNLQAKLGKLSQFNGQVQLKTEESSFKSDSLAS